MKSFDIIVNEEKEKYLLIGMTEDNAYQLLTTTKNFIYANDLNDFTRVGNIIEQPELIELMNM